MYVYALAQEWGSAPGPDDMEKRGEEGKGKGKKQAVVLVDMPVIAPKGARRRGIATAPLGGSAHPRRASGTEAAT